MDKNTCTVYTALKATVSDVIPQEEAPMTEYDDIPVDILFSSLSIVSRMTQSVYYDIYINLALVELNRKIQAMLK